MPQPAYFATSNNAGHQNQPEQEWPILRIVSNELPTNCPLP